MAVYLFKMAATVVAPFTLTHAYGPRKANMCLRAFRHENISTAHAQPFRGARDLAFCLKVPLESLLYERAAEVLARLRGWTGSP